MRPDPLSDAAARRHELTRAKAIQALRELDRAGTPVTFAGVAQAAGFSELGDEGASWRLVPSAGVPDGVEDELDVGPVESGDQVPQVNGCCAGEAGGQVEYGGLAA